MTTEKQKLKHRLLVKECIDGFNASDREKLSQLFYRELFHLDINIKTVFPGSISTLNRKFFSTLGVLKDVKHLEKISQSIEQLGQRHLLRYGAQIKHFELIEKALIYALAEHMKEKFTDDLKTAWRCVYGDVAKIMKQAMISVDRRADIRDESQDINNDDGMLLDEIGGEEIITQVHKRFYDVMFEHPWLGQFFYGKSKPTLIRKQTQFMIAAFNGPNNYQGDTPAFIHMHMFITDEMSDLRSQILKEAILAEGLSESIAERWLAVDNAFRPSIVKKSIDECVMKCLGQQPVIANKP